MYQYQQNRNYAFITSLSVPAKMVTQVGPSRVSVLDSQKSYDFGKSRRGAFAHARDARGWGAIF